MTAAPKLLGRSVSPLKPHLGPGFEALVRRLQAAVAERYLLPAWTPATFALHKHADRLAAASEALSCRRLEPGGDARQSRHLARAARG